MRPGRIEQPAACISPTKNASFRTEQPAPLLHARLMPYGVYTAFRFEGIIQGAPTLFVVIGRYRKSGNLSRRRCTPSTLIFWSHLCVELVQVANTFEAG